ncbi:hypothetical protein [Ligilactobacillus acidipiscis]|uniref:hypothetical protein n=1 Tax=Ligilactobacillus acidipiscis TaxID=89059 RepID=UPI0023F8A56B|nr:hypothetical protein [Ligilactobacillus acidipiscis]WEV56679.1 hypothetical protein OZX66_10710 [Ligilactobacillus acidipiscis]
MSEIECFDNNIVFSVFSGYSNREIFLYESNLANHLINLHADRDRNFLLDPKNLNIVANVIKDPDLVSKDLKHEERLNYFSIVNFTGFTGPSNVRITTEVVDAKKGELVTISPFNHSSMRKAIGGGIIYDKHNT